MMHRSCWTGCTTTMSEPFKLTGRVKDITGQTLGSLTALRPVRRSQTGDIYWEFKCACGSITEAKGSTVRHAAKAATNPQVPSCGCVKDRVASETNTTHGYWGHPLYYVFNSMKQRCYNPNHPEYLKYGGKGVTVCAEWLNDVSSFIRWALTNGWEEGLQIDKDICSDAQGVDRTYSPNTCKFIPHADNVRYAASRTNHKHNKTIKLTPENAEEIRKAYFSGELNQRELANIYSVSRGAIQGIVNPRKHR